MESNETMEQITQKSSGCPIPGGVSGQDGWSPGQPHLVGGNPAHGCGVATK